MNMSRLRQCYNVKSANSSLNLNILTFILPLTRLKGCSLCCVYVPSGSWCPESVSTRCLTISPGPKSQNLLLRPAWVTHLPGSILMSASLSSSSSFSSWRYLSLSCCVQHALCLKICDSVQKTPGMDPNPTLILFLCCSSGCQQFPPRCPSPRAPLCQCSYWVRGFCNASAVSPAGPQFNLT